MPIFLGEWNIPDGGIANVSWMPQQGTTEQIAANVDRWLNQWEVPGSTPQQAYEFTSAKGFYPEQRMSRMEALESYTINGAYAAFEEDLKGSLTPGKLADVTILSKDILTIPEEEIPTAEVVYTIVGGEVVYRAGR